MSNGAHVCKSSGRCSNCGRPALISSKRPKGKRRLHTERRHGQCARCWRDQFNHSVAVRAGLLLLLLLLAGTGRAQTTTVIGTFLDTSGSLLVSGGQVTFDLRPGIDSTISGNARFVPVTTTCTINQSNSFSASGLARSGNTVTVTFTVAHPFVVGDTLTVSGMTDATFNGTVTVLTVADTTHLTYSQTGANATSGGGTLTALRNAGMTASCKVNQNTALSPSGTYYNVCLWPGFARISCFNWYAIGAGPVDLSTAVPTPAGLPAYAFVDTFSNQSVGGNKTFTGSVTILGSLNLPGAANFTGNFISTSANPSTTGVLRVSSGDSGLCWRNNANTGNLCFTKTAGDVLQFNGATIGTGGTVTSVGLSVPSWLAVSGSPVTTTGTLGLTAAGGQGANQFLATPNGVAGAVSLRGLVTGDLPGGVTGSGPVVLQNNGTINPNVLFLNLVAMTNVPQMMWTAYADSYTSGSLTNVAFSLMDSNQGAIFINAERLALRDVPSGCSTPTIIEIFDETAGAAITGSAITLVNGQQEYGQGVAVGVAAGHILDFRATQLGTGCVIAADGFGMSVGYRMQ